MTVLLFAGARYYPDGGWGDYIATFASVEEARSWLLAQSTEHPNEAHWWTWAEIVEGDKLVEWWNRESGTWITGLKRDDT